MMFLFAALHESGEVALRVNSLRRLNFGRDRSKADIPQASAASPPDENDPDRSWGASKSRTAAVFSVPRCAIFSV
jgi:hypothetical protein